MTEAAKSFIDEIAARYGIRIGRDDPVMMVYTLLEEGATEVLNESRKLLSVFQEASSDGLNSQQYDVVGRARNPRAPASHLGLGSGHGQLEDMYRNGVNRNLYREFVFCRRSFV